MLVILLAIIEQKKGRKSGTPYLEAISIEPKPGIHAFVALREGTDGFKGDGKYLVRGYLDRQPYTRQAGQVFLSLRDVTLSPSPSPDQLAKLLS